MIPQEYVSEFLPIHELDNLGPNTQYKDGNLVFANLSDDDLFLVSKLCSVATDTDEAIMVSKSLKYGDLKYKLSDEYSIQQMKDNIYKLSSDLCEFSCDMYLCMIPFLSTYTEICCTNISTELKNDIIWISGTYIPQVSGDLMDVITYVSCTLCAEKTDKQRYDVISSLCAGYFIKSFRFDSEGHVQPLTPGDIDAVSSYLTIDGTSVAGGTLAGDTSHLSTIYLQNDTTREIRYCVNEDSYVTMALSVWEDDSCDKPLEVWLHNQLSGEDYEMKLGQFNNPGGFSGLKYFNYYFDGFPIKQRNDPNDTRNSVTSVYIKYQDNQYFRYDSTNKSVFEISEHPFYATVAKNDLSNYVEKNSLATATDSLQLYKIETDHNGLVINHVKYDPADMGNDIPTPSPSQAGTIKTGKSNSYTTEPQILGLRVDGNKNGYVESKIASSENYGTIKIGLGDVNTSNVQEHGIKLNSKNVAYVNVQCSTPTTYGTAKVHQDSDESTANVKNGYLRVPVKIDSNGQLFADILEGTSSTSDKFTICKTYDNSHSSDTSRYLQSDNSGHAYVKLNVAGNGTYGIVKLGSAATDGEVYAASDGKAKVNFSLPTEEWVFTYVDSSGTKKTINKIVYAKNK